MAENSDLNYKIKEIKDGSVILEAEVEKPKQRKGSTSGKAQSATNNIVSQLATNTYNNGIFTSNAAQNFLQNEIQNGTYNKKEGVISEKESVRRAKENVNNDRQQVINRIEKVKHIDGVMLDEAMTVLQEEIAKAEQTGNWDEVRRLSKLTQEKITDAARAVQANAKYTRNAAGAIMRTQRLMDDYGIDKNISNEDYSEVNRLFKEAEKVGIDTRKGMEIENKAYAILAKYLPDSTFLDKWNAWRYLAMLGNTRTHLRNFIGNTMFGAVTNIKDSLAGAMEAAFIRDSSKRTKSALVTDGQLLKDSREDAENVWRQLTDGGTKFDIKAGSESEKRIFKNKLLEWARRFNSDMLTKEDNFALMNKYQTALAGYLQARGKDSSIFKSQNQSDIDLLNEARSYAIDEAKKATFHEDNVVANALEKASKYLHNSESNVLKAGGYALDAIFPFKKTPANVLQQGVWEYNPVQVMHGVVDYVKNSDNPSKAIDEIARGLTGTGIVALGAWLASKGILRAKGDKDNKDIDNLTGQQDFSINVDGKSYTFDWAAPSALPLFVGAELYDWSQGKGDFWSAFAAIGDPVVEMSMLQGLKNNIESIASFDSEKTTGGELVMNIGLGYASQGVPTMLGQVARATDDTRRSTYTGESGTTDTLMKGIKKIQNKIPVLSQQNEPYLDRWGEEQKNEGGSFLGRLAYNMLSPGYFSDTTMNQTEQELSRLTEEMNNGTIDNANIIPATAEKKYNKEQLTPEQYTEYQRIKGQNAQDILGATVGSETYSGLDDNGKADLLKEMLQFSNALSKKQMFDYDIEGGSYKKEYEAYQHGGTHGLIDYLGIKSDLGGSQANEVLIDSLENRGLSDEDKLFYFKQNKKSYSDKAKYLDSVNAQYAYDWYKIQAEYGTKKDDIAFGILVSDLPQDEKEMLSKVAGMKDDDVKFELLLNDK